MIITGKSFLYITYFINYNYTFHFNIEIYKSDIEEEFSEKIF